MPARILVIEDNKDNLELLSFLLTAFGHTVLGAKDGEEGLEIARRELPDLVLSDLQMPKMDGYQVARTLRQDPRFAKCPLIAVSSYAMRGDRERGLEAGFDGYISKPIAPQEFVSQIESFLGETHHSVATRVYVSEPEVRVALPHRATILAVDNSPANLSLIESILGPFGYEVIRVATAAEAVQRALANPPDLILSDLHMPQTDGYELLRTIRREPSLRAVPFVIISSTLWPEKDVELSLAAGVSRFITRPLDPKELLTHIEECLRQPVSSERE